MEKQLASAFKARFIEKSEGRSVQGKQEEGDA